MFRRDFLKALGIVSTTVAIPVVPTLNAATTPSSSPIPDNDGLIQLPGLAMVTPDSSFEPSKDLTFHFKFYDDSENSYSPVTIITEEGSFQYAEELDFSFLRNRGEFSVFKVGLPKFTFTLDMLVKSISNADLLKEIHGHKYFDLQVVGGRETAFLDRCLWETFEYDMLAGSFCLSGRTVQFSKGLCDAFTFW